MKIHLLKHKKEYISVLILMVATATLLIVLMQLWNMDINIPIKYDGLDETSMLTNAKMFKEQLWCMSTNRLGAPFGTQYYDFSSNVLHNVDLITLKLFAILSNNAVVAYNLTFFSTFFITVIISYFVMKELKLSNWVAMCASLTFSFLPYLFIRGTYHYVLTTCYFIPLSVLLCIWAYEKEDILVLNKQFFRNKRNWLVILFAFLIANNGIAYYPFFTCYLLGLTALSKTIKTKKIKSMVKPIIMVALICFFMFLDLASIFIYNLQHGSNKAAIVRGGFVETEMFGLKIAQLFLPVDGHKIPILTKIIDYYNTTAPAVNENVSAYLGIMGICGFLFLCIILLSKKTAENSRLILLSELNIFMVLLGTSSGLCTIFSIAVSDLLRAYNRISIYIGFVCILAFAIGVDRIYRKYKKKWIIVIGILFTLFCIVEQYPVIYRPTYELNASNYNSDEKFVSKLESQVSTGAMVYQLPYHEYPEGGTVYLMYDYQLFTGYIHSKNIKWSYGSIKGRDTDDWNKNIASLEIPKMVEKLKDQGFEAIYIDRRAYEPGPLEDLENSLKSVLNEDAVISDDGNLSYFLIK